MLADVYGSRLNSRCLNHFGLENYVKTHLVPKEMFGTTSKSASAGGVSVAVWRQMTVGWRGSDGRCLSVTYGRWKGVRPLVPTNPITYINSIKRRDPWGGTSVEKPLCRAGEGGKQFVRWAAFVGCVWIFTLYAWLDQQGDRKQKLPGLGLELRTTLLLLPADRTKIHAALKLLGIRFPARFIHISLNCIFAVI